MAQVIQQEYLLTPISELQEHPQNPNRGQTDAIRDSIEYNGFHGAILVQQQTGYIVAGNHRFRAAVAAGITEIPAFHAELSEEQAMRIMLVDNRTRDLATSDDEQLIALLDKLKTDFNGIEGTGFKEDDLAALLDDMAREKQNERKEEKDQDKAPDPSEGLADLYGTQEGQTWDIVSADGERTHVLSINDCAKQRNVVLALRGRKADMYFTDPPYGVKYVDTKGRSIRNDDTEDLFASGFHAAVKSALNENARMYVCGGYSNYKLVHELFEAATGREPRPIVWVKEHFVMSRQNYHRKTEWVYYGYLGEDVAPASRIVVCMPTTPFQLEEEKPLGEYMTAYSLVHFGWMGKGGADRFWYGDRTQHDVWHVSRPLTSTYMHPNQKPVELVVRAIENSCPLSGLVFDSFGGSGSTMVASEVSGRESVLMEIDRRWAAVILHRMKTLGCELNLREGS